MIFVVDDMENSFDKTINSSEFAEEFFVAEFQSRLANMLDDHGMTRAELARKLGVSRARVTQIFSDEASNFTLRLLYRSFVALGDKPVIISCSEYENLKRLAAVNGEGSGSVTKDRAGPNSLPDQIIAELLRANTISDNSDLERSSRRGNSARSWADSGPNVFPIREASNG